MSYETLFFLSLSSIALSNNNNNNNNKKETFKESAPQNKKET